MKAWMTAEDKEFLEIVRRNRSIGFGRMMQIISEFWMESDPKGALSVGDTYAILDVKRERCKKEGHDIRHGQNWDWCDRCDAMINPETGKVAT